MLIRPAEADDFGALGRIELAAGELFRGILESIADAPLAPPSHFAAAAARGEIWVAAVDSQVVAYIQTEQVDRRCHIEQLSLDPAFAGHGYGADLIAHAARRASNEGLAGLTLTTYRDIPWNAPYYRRLAFREMAADEIGPQLQAVRDHETAAGLDIAARVAMLRAPA